MTFEIITWLPFLSAVISLRVSHQFFSQWEAKPKPVAIHMRDLSRALSKLQVIARNPDSFIAPSAPVVFGRSNYFAAAAERNKKWGGGGGAENNNGHSVFISPFPPTFLSSPLNFPFISCSFIFNMFTAALWCSHRKIIRLFSLEALLLVKPLPTIDNPTYSLETQSIKVCIKVVFKSWWVDRGKLKESYLWFKKSGGGGGLSHDFILFKTRQE